MKTVKLTQFRSLEFEKTYLNRCKDGYLKSSFISGKFPQLHQLVQSVGDTSCAESAAVGAAP